MRDNLNSVDIDAAIDCYENMLFSIENSEWIQDPDLVALGGLLPRFGEISFSTLKSLSEPDYIDSHQYSPVR